MLGAKSVVPDLAPVYSPRGEQRPSPHDVHCRRPVVPPHADGTTARPCRAAPKSKLAKPQREGGKAGARSGSHVAGAIRPLASSRHRHGAPSARLVVGPCHADRLQPRRDLPAGLLSVATAGAQASGSDDPWGRLLLPIAARTGDDGGRRPGIVPRVDAAAINL